MVDCSGDNHCHRVGLHIHQLYTYRRNLLSMKQCQYIRHIFARQYAIEASRGHACKCVEVWEGTCMRSLCWLIYSHALILGHGLIAMDSASVMSAGPKACNYRLAHASYHVDASTLAPGTDTDLCSAQVAAGSNLTVPTACVIFCIWS